MPVIHWNSPDEEKWKVHCPKDFKKDVLFARFPKEGGLIEGFSSCSYVLEIVEEEYTRPKNRRRKELRLAARDIKGRPAVLIVPYELLEAVVARGFVFPLFFRWLWSLPDEMLLKFYPAAKAGERRQKVPKSLLMQCLKNLAKLKEEKDAKDPASLRSEKLENERSVFME